MKIHFAYFGDPLNDGSIHTPETIANRMYRYLEKRAEVQYYNFMDFTTTPDVAPDDIILGHPHPWPGLFIERFFKEKCKARYLIWPLHSRIPEINRFSIPYAKQADKLFTISGPYWIDTLSETEFAFMLPKIIRLDNSVDANQDIWQLAKKNFNPKKQRGLFTMGRSGPEKGTTELFKLLSKTNCPLMVAGEFSGDDLNILKDRPNTTIIGKMHWWNEQLKADIINRCDFFVNMSVSDASPTTVLESMALGLIPITTKECGYQYDSFLPFNLGDETFNLNSLSHAQEIEEEDLKILQVKNRKLIEEVHNWDRFCSTVWENIQ